MSTSIKVPSGETTIHLSPEMGHTQSLYSNTLRPAVNTITRHPRLRAESSVADAVLVRASVRLPPCWLSRSCKPRSEPPDDACSTCADETPSLNSSFWAELVTPLLTKGSYSDLSQTLVRLRKLFSCCGRLGKWRNRRLLPDEPNRSTRGPKRDKRNVRDSKNPRTNLRRPDILIQGSDCQADGAKACSTMFTVHYIIIVSHAHDG